MNASVRLSVPTHRIMLPHTQHALEHLRVQLLFKTSLHWPGIRRPLKTSCPQRSSVSAYASAWEQRSFRRTYRVATSHRQAPAAHTCLIDMGP
eukprot:3976803-Amphidinium_carterae.1